MLLVLVTVMLASGSPARSSPFEVYGFGSRAIAMGNAQGAAVRDHPALYYNPANLTFRTQTHLGLGLSLVMPALNVALPPTYEGHEPTLPETNLGFSAGLVFPLGGLLDYRVAVGFAAFLPLIQLTRLESIDPCQPYFYVYQSLPDHVVLLPAVGLRLTPWLRTGAAVQVLAAMDSSVSVRADVPFRRIDERSMVVEMDASYGPIFGFTLTAGPVDIGLTYRDDIELRFHLPVDLLFTDMGTLAIDVGATALYSPAQVNLGVAWQLRHPDLLLAADATLAFWSNAPSPAAWIDAVMTDEELHPEEEIPEILFDFHTSEFYLGAEDILVPRLGAEWQVNPTIALRSGLFYRPSPIPDQTGSSNILDSSAVVVSLGAGATFPDTLQVTDQPFYVDLHFQWTHLNERTTVKDPEAGANFLGRTSSGGDIFHFGLELRQDF
ncbi:MAG: outer membrane protein transport protein [Bradymonadales bacterium]|nr:outer membrane protein transport protein [Bradymonadales bacterium]